MKKSLLFTVVWLMSLGVFAQPFVLRNVLQKNQNAVPEVMNSPKVLKAPQHALPSGQYYCGLYTTDEYDQYGYGLGSTLSGVCKVGTLFASDIYQGFLNFKVVGMRVALCCNVTQFSVYISKTQNGNISNATTVVEKSVGSGKTGWNTVMFDATECFTLSGSDTYLTGYSYYQKKGTTDDCYPISYVEGTNPNADLFVYANIPASAGGSGLGWYDVTGGGSLAVQWIVEGELPDQNVILSDFSTEQFVKSGGSLPCKVQLTNMGSTAISSVGFSVSVDGVNLSEVSSTVSVASAEKKTATFNVNIPSSISVGKHTLKLELSKINGAAPTGNVGGTLPEKVFRVYESSVARQKYLIEHITSWTCTYCYLGYNVLRKIESSHDDVAWVAVHGNQSSNQDPYFFSTCNDILSYLNVSGFPSAAYNRLYITELAEGPSLAYGLGYNESYTDQVADYVYGLMTSYSAKIPSQVKLEIEQSYDKSSRKLDITVKGTGVSKAAQVIDDHCMFIYLTEQGLVGQQYSSGAWNNSFEHNNTLRAVLTDVYGDQITWSGDNFTYTTSYTIPADYNADNLSITAFIAPKPSSQIEEMAVNNCERVAVNTSSTGIQTVGMGGDIHEVARYTLDGKQLTAPAKGVNIVRLSDGSIRKVIVK